MPAEFNISLIENNQKVRLKITPPDGPAAWADLESHEIDSILQGFSALRQQMPEQIPEKLDPKPRLPTIPFPNWWVFNPKPDGQSLALRHPGFGWMSFRIAQDEADKIAGWLKRPYVPPSE